MIPNRPETIQYPDLYATAERLSDQTPDVTHRANHVLSIYRRLVEQRENPNAVSSDASWSVGAGYSVGDKYEGKRWPDRMLPNLTPVEAGIAVEKCELCTSNGLIETETGWSPCQH